MLAMIRHRGPDDDGAQLVVLARECSIAEIENIRGAWQVTSDKCQESNHATTGDFGNRYDGCQKPRKNQ